MSNKHVKSTTQCLIEAFQPLDLQENPFPRYIALIAKGFIHQLANDAETGYSPTQFHYQDQAIEFCRVIDFLTTLHELKQKVSIDA